MHVGVTVMLWGCFPASGPGASRKLDGIMKEEYL